MKEERQVGERKRDQKEEENYKNGEETRNKYKKSI